MCDPPSLLPSPVPRLAPQGTPEALPYPILHGLSRPRGAALRLALGRLQWGCSSPRQPALPVEPSLGSLLRLGSPWRGQRLEARAGQAIPLHAVLYLYAADNVTLLCTFQTCPAHPSSTQNCVAALSVLMEIPSSIRATRILNTFGREAPPSLAPPCPVAAHPRDTRNRRKCHSSLTPIFPWTSYLSWSGVWQSGTCD